MSDDQDGRSKGGKNASGGRGPGRGPRPGGEGRPGGGGRGNRPGGDARPGRPGGKPSFRPRGERSERGEGDGAGSGEGRKSGPRSGAAKPFAPKSRGMMSHGGPRTRDGDRDEGGARKPRSFGKRDHPGGGAGEARRAPRELSETGEGRPARREGRPFAGKPRRDGEGPRDGGFRRREDGDRPRSERSERPAFRKDGEGFRPRRDDARPQRFEDRKPREDARRPREDAAPSDTMRIARRLARAGIASRRDAEGMIADGRVKVNGKLIDSPALDVKASDRIEIDGAPLPASERTRLWLFHKPAGTVTTNKDPEGRPTVFDRLPDDMPRVLTVGRLDINTEGLLLLTNDGGLARVLELPSTGWLRRYRVRAHGEINQARLDELAQGIAIDGVFYGAIEAVLDREQGHNVWLTLGLREGKNREVKKVLGHLGLEVNRLIRLSFGPFQLGDLAEGAVREVKGRTLRDQLGDRLIEEAGADFEGPITKPFSNKPVETEGTRGPRRTSDWVSAGGAAAPNRKKFGEKKRESALERLDTRPRRDERPGGGKGGPGAKPGFKPRGDRSERGDEAPAERAAKRPGIGATGRRNTNVWIAPGARPEGKKRIEAKQRSAESAGGEDRPKRGPARPAPVSGRNAPGRGGPGGKPGPRGDRPRGPRKD